MDYTKTYHLPQWEKSDRIMMDDFNAMCMAMEEGLTKTARDAASGASQANTNAAALANKAQEAADAAMAAAQAAQKTADNAYCPGNVPYSTGAYTGNGSVTTVNLGYRPKFIILTGQSIVSNTNFVRDIIIAAPGIMGDVVTFLSNGFTIQNPSNPSVPFYPRLNNEGENYAYIAFR